MVRRLKIIITFVSSLLLGIVFESKTLFSNIITIFENLAIYLDYGLEAVLEFGNPGKKENCFTVGDLARLKKLTIHR